MSGLILPFAEWQPEIASDAFIASDATVIGRVRIGAKANIWYKCLLRGDVEAISVGANSNLQDGTVVHVDERHPVWIGENVTIGHMALVHGCTLESGAFIGMRATVMDGCVIESGAMLAAGALLTPGKRIPAGQIWAGNPAKYMRELRADDVSEFNWIVGHYVELSERHRASIEKPARIAANSAEG